MSNVKTVSFLSGKTLIGDVQEDGSWKNALFVSIVQNPETGERMAQFWPSVLGRDSQDLTREEFCQLTEYGKSACVGPCAAAKGLKAAYESFVADEWNIERCVDRYTRECGPKEIAIDSECDPKKRQACTPRDEGNIILGVFQPEMKRLGDESEKI